MKRILSLIFGLFFLPTFGGCFEPADGMNLWRMTAQVGSCLDIVLCSVGSVVPIMQSDLASTYTIGGSNYYKICENITSSNAIIVEADDVVLDLGNYFLSGVPIIVSNNVKNLLIKNGTMQNTAENINLLSGCQNIMIQNITFDTAVSGPSTYGIQVNGPLLGLTISNVSAYDAAPKVINLVGSSGSLINNVLIDNLQCVSTNQSLSATPGTDATIKMIYCENATLQNVTVNDPYQGLDCILMRDCNGISLDTVSISSDLSNVGSAAGVNAIDSSYISHTGVDVSGAAFTIGFNINVSDISSFLEGISYDTCSANSIDGNGFTLNNSYDVSYTECTATQCTGNGMFSTLCVDVSYTNCVTNRNTLSGLYVNITLNSAVTAHSANLNGLSGIDLFSCGSMTVEDCVTFQNEGDGLHIDFTIGGLVPEDIVISGCVSSNNEGSGAYIATAQIIVIGESSFLSNGEAGLSCAVVDNLVVSGCTAQSNLVDGFRIQGANGGSVPTGIPPSAAQGTNGRSPVHLEDCTSTENGVSGFYFTDIGGALIDSCFASYNGGNGFWFDSNSWNLHVRDCVATSNAQIGFETWDSSLGIFSTAANRFHACLASYNCTNHPLITDPAGATDYSTDNAGYPGVPMISPIGAPVQADTTMLAGSQDLVPVDWSQFR